MNNSAPFHIIHENSNSFWRHLEWCNQQCTVMWRRYFIFIFSNIQTGLDSRDGNVTRPHCPCHARTMQQTKIKCWTSNLKFPFYFPKMTPANSILKGKKKKNKTKTRNNNNFIHACTLHKYIIHSLSQPVKNKTLVYNTQVPLDTSLDNRHGDFRSYIPPFCLASMPDGRSGFMADFHWVPPLFTGVGSIQTPWNK